MLTGLLTLVKAASSLTYVVAEIAKFGAATTN